MYAFSAWVIVNYLADNDPARSLLWTRLAFAGQSVVAWFYTLFVINFPSRDRFFSRFTKIINILGIIIFIASCTSLIASSIRFDKGVANVEGGPLFGIYTIYYVVTFMGIVALLIHKRRHLSGTDRAKINMILFGLVLSGMVGIPLNLVVPLIVGQNQYAIYGGYSVIFLALFTSYSIIRHKLFNIRAAIARSLAYILSIATIGLLYSFLAYGVIGDYITTRIFTSEPSVQVVNTVIAILLAYTFLPIRNFFQRITDRIFYKDRYDPQELISSIGRVLAAEIELDPLAKQVSRIISEQMRLAEANIIVLANHKIFYQTSQDKIKHIYHPAELEKIAKKPLIIDELPSGEKRQLLEQHNVSATFPLRTREGLIGHLMLGEKKSGDIFATQDIQTLHIISDELAIAIQNARSYLEIQRFNETLREKIALATKELRHANSELKDLDRAKDEFISMASHQLRTPLSAVRGYTSMVMEGDFGKLTKEQSENLKQSFDAATRMARLVDDLLNVSRIQSGKFKIERTSVDLNTVLPEEISLLSTTAKTKNVTVNYHAPEKHVPLISVDEGKTRQCVMNLIDNAIYYSASAKDGGKVDVYLTGDENAITFKVVDNGIGVPKDQQSKLFSKFYRAPNAQQTRPDGTGLGLFLVGKVISEQGGKILFESTEGKSSTFGWTLPISGENVKKAAGKG